jgi:hypothetical protein
MKSLNSSEYKAAEETVLGELQLGLLKAKIEDRNFGYNKDSSEEQLIEYGLKDFFGNFYFLFPGYPGEKRMYGNLRDMGINPITKEIKEFFELKKRTKELISEIGLNKNKIEELMLNFWKKRIPGSYLAFVDYVFPVYVMLRMEGYEHNYLHQ